jgi:hypothetical protein
MQSFTRLTNAFRKKAENHGHSVAAHYMYYNFARVHISLRSTPAMRAGVADHLSSATLCLIKHGYPMILLPGRRAVEISGNVANRLC